ncbi:MAG: sugar-binding transcriptional regulator [Bacillota bacterium]
MDSDVYSQSNWIVIKVAELYYLQGKSQKEIAFQLNISESTTSRLIRRAKEEGVVEFVIRNPYMDSIALSNELIEKYGLKDAVVIPTSGMDFGDPMLIKKMVAREGARYLQRVLKPHDILGIAWGGTIYHLIHYLNPCQKSDNSFITLHGSLSRCAYELDARTLVSRMAMALGGTQHALLCESLFKTAEIVQHIRNEESAKQIFKLFDQITISLSGVGSLYPLADSPLARIQYLHPSEFEDLKSKGVYGDLMLRFFDKDGQECESSLVDRTLAISFDTYKKIPCKIVVASGAHKAHTIRAILKGKLLDVLIVDFDLARETLELD